MYRATLIVFSTLVLAACGSGGDNDATNVSVASSSAAVAPMTSMERGAILFKRCRACHTLDQGDRHKVGPNLWGVFGQTSGTRDDFNYSAAMAGSDIVWTDATISAYLEKPSTYLPGNRMSFAGLRKEKDRLAVIEYLRANTGAEALGAEDTSGG
ncbi:cytochrome c [Algimonas arctica]|uniref:Cytochrome c n=1 Tax=Algimonas arctica TaxID=1479486 RepID=A0A8J3G2S8_9PROT|nr:cytochrome c family protein [Algimonas arctica]GHA97524.1 cytochrome c [Algimonas arctica]